MIKETMATWKKAAAKLGKIQKEQLEVRRRHPIECTRGTRGGKEGKSSEKTGVTRHATPRNEPSPEPLVFITPVASERDGLKIFWGERAAISWGGGKEDRNDRHVRTGSSIVPREKARRA